MPPNTSATGGALLPSGVAPPSEIDFDRILTRLVRGVAGLPDGRVRPRYQEKPPAQLPKTVDWCAIGVMRIPSEGNVKGNFVRNPEGDGSSTQRTYEVIELMASFYGPNAQSFASIMRDGLKVPQNRDILFHAHTSLVDIGDVVQSHDLVNTTNRRRYDLTFRLRRRIDRVYAILNVEEAVGTIHAERHDQDWSTEN